MADWYDDFLSSIGVSPGSTEDWSNAESPSNQQILDSINYSGSPLSMLSNLFSGSSSLGKAGQFAGLAGLAGMINSMFGSSGGQYAGYQGGIPKYTASRTMNAIPTMVANEQGEMVRRRPGSGGITYFTPMTYTPAQAAAAPAETPAVEAPVVQAPAAEPVGGAAGGIMGLQHYNLGGYSDGGRLLRGPGDGVSDDIPATIGDRQPARLADGEFVVPARIVSELGNGSTEAGARKLYAMMDRVKKTRMKSNKNIAADTKADKHLPA